MGLKQRIEEDLSKSLKEGNSFRVGVLRMVKAACINKEIEKRGSGGDSVLTDDELISLLNREVKKRREAIELFKKGNRFDLVDKETREVSILEEYLPRALGNDEIKKIIDKIISTGKYGSNDFGLVMKEAMKELKGRVEGGGRVVEIIKEKLRNL